LDGSFLSPVTPHDLDIVEECADRLAASTIVSDNLGDQIMRGFERITAANPEDLWNRPTHPLYIERAPKAED
jgi:hypothetical protein